MYPTESPDFTGKYVWVRTNHSVALQDAKLVLQAGRLFIAGKSVGNLLVGGVADGVVVAFAWDAVEGYHVYDSFDALCDTLKRAGEWWARSQKTPNSK